MIREHPVVTGIGIISPIGCDRESFTESILAGRSGITSIDDFDTSPFKCSWYAPVRENLADIGNIPDHVTEWDRHAVLAYLAARAALEDAGFKTRWNAGDRPVHDFGLVFATCSGGMLSIEKHYAEIFGSGEKTFHLTRTLADNKRYFQTARRLAREFGITGFFTTVVTACAASANAIGLAGDLIRSGKATRVLVAGADSFAPSTFSGFDFLRATSDSPCAPFSKPIGLNLGEGAGAWIIESNESAKEADRQVYGHLKGYGLGNDAYHPTTPDPSARGAILAMTRALNDAGVPREEIGYINAHGTGTLANDKTESRAVTQVFSHGAEPPISSTKSYIGHTLGAAGILEASASLLALNRGFIPATLNFTSPRDGCHLDYIPNHCRRNRSRTFLSNSFAFAGNNCSLVIGRGSPAGEIDPIRPEFRRVFITGTGAITAVGQTVDALVSALAENKSGISPIDRFPLSTPGVNAGLCDIDALIRSDRRLPLKSMDNASRFATTACKTALKSAGLSLKPRECGETGCIIGLTYGPNSGEYHHLKSIFTHGLQVPNLVKFPFIVLNSIGGTVCRSLMLRGISSTLCSGPGAGLDSVIYGFMAVKQGLTECVATGAVDELSHRLVEDLIETGQMGESGRQTLIPGEGAAFITVESEANCRNRAERILCEILDWTTCPMWSEDAESNAIRFTAAIRNMLENNRISPGDITMICDSDPALDRDHVADLSLNPLFPHTSPPRLSVSTLTGTLFASAALLNLAAALNQIESGHILVLSTAVPGKAYCLLVRKDI